MFQKVEPEDEVTDRTRKVGYLYIHTYMHAYIHTYLHAYLHTYIHTYIHTYLHTYIHTYILYADMKHSIIVQQQI